jgi:hypothetical protein
MFNFSFNRNKSLETAAAKVLNEAFSFNRSPITQNSAFATQGSVHDRLMSMGQNKRPLGGLEVPGSSVEDTEDAFSRTLTGMGYKQGIDPESGKPTLYGGPSKPSLSLGTGGRMLQQSPVAYSSRTSQSATTSQSAQPQKEEPKDRVLSTNEQGNIRREILGGKERNTYAYYKGQAPSKGMEYRYSEKDELGRNRDIYTMAGSNPRL